MFDSPRIHPDSPLQDWPAVVMLMRMGVALECRLNSDTKWSPVTDIDQYMRPNSYTRENAMFWRRRAP